MLQLLGTRGTMPVSGQKFVKYGGNTTCLMSPVDDRTCIVIDGGTGIMRLNKYKKFKEYHIFLSHLHWDHIVGVPILQAFYNPECTVNIYLENKPSLRSTDILDVLFKPPFFPVPKNKLMADIRMHLISGGDQITLGDVSIHVAEGNHPDGVLMYKLVYPDKRVLFTSDYEHGTATDDFLIEFAYKCDYLIYDTTYQPDEYAGIGGYFAKTGWGHSTYEQGIEFVKKADVKNLVMFHHNPDYDDITLDEMGILARRSFKNTFVAFDGMII